MTAISADGVGIFVPGQLVLVTRQAGSHEGDWSVGWNDAPGCMDRAIGQIGRVLRLNALKGVSVTVPETDRGWGEAYTYPAFILEAVTAGPVSETEFRAMPRGER